MGAGDASSHPTRSAEAETEPGPTLPFPYTVPTKEERSRPNLAVCNDVGARLPLRKWAGLWMNRDG